MSGDAIAGVAAIAMALVLAISALRGRRVSPKRLLIMGGIWVAIIIVVVAVIQWRALAVA